MVVTWEMIDPILLRTQLVHRHVVLTQPNQERLDGMAVVPKDGVEMVGHDSTLH